MSNQANPPIPQLLRIMTTALGSIIAVVWADATAQITNWTATGAWLWFAAFATLLANMIVMLRAQSASLIATQQPASSHTRATPPIDRI